MDSTRRDKCFAAAAEAMIAGNTLPDGWSWVVSSLAARVARFGGEKSDGENSHPGKRAGKEAGGRKRVSGGEKACEVRSYYLKCFLPRSRWETLKAYLHGSRCARAIRESERLRRCGIATPAIIAAGRVDGRDWMVTEGVEAIGVGIYLYAFLKRPRSSDRLRWKRRVIVELGKFVGNLHRQGIVHGDLRLNNILIDIHCDRPKFLLIDNERNRHYRFTIPSRLIRKNLVQVNMVLPSAVTRGDRLRFFGAYRESFAEDPAGDPKKLIVAVQRRTLERMGAKPFSDRVDKAVWGLSVTNVPE